MKKFICTLAIMAFFSGLLYAQQIDLCKDVLAAARTVYRNNSSYYNEFHKMIDFSTMKYDEFKKEFGSEAKFMVGGNPFWGSMNNDQFLYSQSKLKYREEISSIQNHIEDIMIISANKTVINAWSKCMESNNRKIKYYIQPQDVMDGKYVLEYKLEFQQGLKVKFEESEMDNLTIVGKSPFKKKKKVVQGKTQLVNLKVKDIRKPAKLTVRTTLEDFQIFIPKYSYMGEYVITEASRDSLTEKLKMGNTNENSYYEYVNVNGTICEVHFRELISPIEVTFSDNVTTLNYRFECIRNNVYYNCGELSIIGEDHYISSAKAELEYSNNSILTIKNIYANEKGKSSKCGDQIYDHLNALNGTRIKLDFVPKDAGHEIILNKQ